MTNANPIFKIYSYIQKNTLDVIDAFKITTCYTKHTQNSKLYFQTFNFFELSNLGHSRSLSLSSFAKRQRGVSKLFIPPPARTPPIGLPQIHYQRHATSRTNHAKAVPFMSAGPPGSNLEGRACHLALKCSLYRVGSGSGPSDLCFRFLAISI